MASTRIATTRSQDVQALVTAGQSTLDGWGVLSALLANRLSPDHAALLAEPVANPARGETDWYSTRDGPAVLLSSLPPDERTAIRSTLARLTTDIQTLADRLETSRIDSERPLGALLKLAMRIPAESTIYAQDGHAVLVAWGHTRSSGPDRGSVDLRGIQAAPLAPMTILPSPPVSLVGPIARLFGRWSRALVTASLLLLLLFILIMTRDPFGWFDVAGPNCQVAMNDVSLLSKLREQQDHGVALRTMLADLAGDAGRRRLMCPAPPAPPPPPPVPSEDRRLAEERGGHSGKLQIVLRWGDRSDLDLHVVCPSGEEIKYDHKAACGGALDVDANGTASQAISNPVENASFPDPAPGRYKIVVIPFEIRPVGAPQTTFRVTVVREGQADEVINGVAPAGPVTQGKTHPGPPQTVTTIEIPAP